MAELDGLSLSINVRVAVDVVEMLYCSVYLTQIFVDLLLHGLPANCCLGVCVIYISNKIPVSYKMKEAVPVGNFRR